MAINSYEFTCGDICSMSQGSLLNPYTNYTPDLSQEESLCNVTHKIRKQKNKIDYTSPYLTGDSVQLLSRVTEKRFIRKKGNHVSSVPISSSIYKVNSDDFRSIKNNGKNILKSVLTLPSDPKPALKLCAVSGVIDSDDDFLKNTEKRSIPSHTRKCRSRGKVYNRDSQCSTDLDTHFGSSHDKLNFFGNNKKPHKTGMASKGCIKENVKPHEVWAMLKNMNRFQFRPSPKISEDSFITKNVNSKRRKIKKDLRVVETRCTEEFAYISSYKMDSPSYSHCSSFDKVTVIDKTQNYRMNSGFENKIPKKKKAKRQGPVSINKSLPNPKSPIQKRNNVKTLHGNQVKGEVNQKNSADFTQQNCIENIHTTSDDLGYESKTTEYDEDLIISENDTRDEISVYSVVYSDNSGSSKAAFLKQAPQRKVSAKEKSVMPNIDDHVKQINGITKVTLGKFQNAGTQHNANKIETVKKISRHVPEARINLSNTPKLTRTEINRQINKYKFPITVLGKDQLRSAMHVVNSEHPQFNGLDEKMWPFMKNSYGVERPPKPIRKQFEQPNRGPRFNETEKKRHSNSPKQKVKDIVKLDRKHTTSPQPKTENMKTQSQLHETKPMQQITDRMLELLYKNTTLRGVDGSHRFGGFRKDELTRINPSTGTQENFNNNGDTTSIINDNYSASTYDSTKNTSTTTKSFVKKHGGSISSNDNNSTAVNDIASKRTTTTTKAYTRKCSWAKAKWANDFIDNVMKKIGSGTYYSRAHNLLNDPQTLSSDKKEEGIQTETNYTKKCSWAKAKWANDFIDNVMKKIGSGTYYSRAHNLLNDPQTLSSDKKEEGIQIETNSSEEFVKPIIIPGFDNEVPEIEIKTMNRHEVTVKHCVTNIILHFDVIVLTKPVDSAMSTSSLIPVTVTKSLTKVYKSPTSILNTMLPAELCSILPKMFSKIVETGQHLTLLSPPVEQISCLSTISEVPTRMEYTNVTEIISMPANWLSVSILPLTSTPPRSLLKGTYSDEVNVWLKFNIPTFPLACSRHSVVEDLKPRLSRAHLFDYDTNLILPMQGTKKMIYNIVPQNIRTASEIQQVNTCTALQPYVVRDHQTVIGSKAMQLTKILESMKTLMNNFGLWIVGMSHNYVNINMKIEQLHKIPELQTLGRNNSNLVCLNNYSNSLNTVKIITPIPNLMNKIIIEMPKRSTFLQLSLCCKEEQQFEQLHDKKLQENDHTPVNMNTPKKKTFGSFYRKCKSASSIIHGEKSTPLTRIDDLDDFFRILGSTKFLASVFDGKSSLKLMTLLNEMKNWTTDIDAKQALLLLLLSNKKDTPNLVRYRPVILQGIAVKRITKVHELDMEIEVIETENLNGTSPRYEGISYLPASIENQDCLYEELCWIAKNTASDYQKPFNQTSERLLRSLLEKRKKLNPSYLRVMARYVGLGLLKTQGKKQTF